MKELSTAQYAKQAHPTSFMQTTAMAKLREQSGQTVHFFEHQKQFVLISGTPFHASKYYNYYAWFSDQLSADFIKHLKTWCKNHAGLSLTITPNTPIALRDYHGKIIEKLPFDPAALKSNGLKWQGPVVVAPGTYKQWQYVVNLDQPYAQLLQSTFKPKVRHAIATTEKTGIIIQELTPDNLDQFTATLASTADRRHFSARDAKYYQDMLAAFRGDAYGLIAYLDPQKTRKLLSAIIKNASKVQFGTEIGAKAERQLGLIADLEEPTPIYAGFFVDTPRETVYLAGGGPDRFFPFSPVFAVLDRAMRRSASKHIPRFNLYGVDATFDHPTGLLKFKQQFRGFIEQLPGDYVTNLRPLTTISVKATSRLKKSR